jgi:hypothetical protein
MTKFGANQLRNQTPEWVLPAFVAITFICQGLPPIVNGYEMAASTVKTVGIVCDIINLLCAAGSMFFGKTKK